LRETLQQDQLPAHLLSLLLLLALPWKGRASASLLLVAALVAAVAEEPLRALDSPKTLDGDVELASVAAVQVAVVALVFADHSQIARFLQRLDPMH
jgi:hypothetical protein